MHAFVRKLRCQAGYSLVELLVVIPSAIIVFVGVMGLTQPMSRASDDVAARSEAVATQRVGLNRMTREIRQGSTVSVPTSTAVELTTYVRSGGVATPRRVRYACTAGACQRYETAVGGAWPASGVRVVGDVTNADVFSLTNGQVLVKLSIRPRGADNPVTLLDGATLRNA